MLKTHFLTIIPAILALSACGVMNATESMPPKMDAMKNEVQKTNNGMDKMNDSVDQTNSSLNKMSDEVRRTNSGMDNMIDQVKRTNDGIAKTNAAVHNQTMAVALSEMMKPANTASVFPPTGMLPAGQVFAAEASADEILQLVSVYLTDINLVLPDESERDQDGKWNKETIKRMDHDKLVKFMAASIISALAPQSTINEIIHQQIEDGGRFEQTAYAVLMMRFEFTHDILLDGGLLSAPLSNPGLIASAIELSEHLSLISKLPFNEKINVKTTGMLSPDDNIELRLPSGDGKDIWKKIDRAFDSELDPKYRVPTHRAASTLAALRTRVRLHL